MSKTFAPPLAAGMQKAPSVYAVPSKQPANKDYAIPFPQLNKDYAVPQTSPEMSEALTMGGKTTTFAETDFTIEPIKLVDGKRAKTAKILIRMLTRDDGSIKYYNRMIAVVLCFVMLTVVTIAFSFIDNEYMASYASFNEKSEEEYCYSTISLYLNRA
ncbi:hypothetical protein TTRE_0000243601 [Trichuris trichiura]|uniref:Uncharacterized protein n=1 Tax=Trichuris trichiura TaxID=36087 RepID=A0A077Z2C6_TRITR|nr:hypothetical protein TTRE_0000243601 [Trichuris trichiura]